MRTTWAKPDGNHFPGDVIEIDDAVAADHINNRWAEEYDPENAGTVPAPESPASLSAAAAPAAAETAAAETTAAVAPTAPAAK